MDRQRFTGSIGIGIIADGYDRIDEDFLKMAEYQRFIDRKEMMEYFLQPENDDEETKKEPIVTNKLINITKLKKDIKNPDLYETANVCHVFHNRLNLSGFLANHLIEGTDAQTWIAEKLDDFIFPSIEVFFCLKHENAGKIESHLWFFKGLCTYLNPKMC